MLSTSVFFLIIVVVARALYNYRYATFAGFAFSATIIIIDMIATIIAKPILLSHIFTSEPYQPLFILASFFICGIWLYKLLNSDRLHQYMRRDYPEFIDTCVSYGAEIVIFTELTATILAYIFLIQLPDISSQLLLKAVSNPTVGIFSFCMITLIITSRIVYNLLLGNYKTFVFWGVFIASLVLLSIFGTRDNFAMNVIMYVIVNQLIYRYIATENNFYWVFAHSALSEAHFALVLHVLTAAMELIGCLMIVFIFVNSYNSLQTIPVNFAQALPLVM